MNLMTTDLNNINNVIDLLKLKDEERKYSILLSESLSQIDEMMADGWPAQEIAFLGEREDGPIGIPIVLARMVFTILQYCAINNVDLVNAMELLHGSEARNHS